MRLLRDLPQCVLGEHQLDVLEPEEALVLLHQRVLGLGEDAHEVFLGELLDVSHDGQAAHELGDHAEVVEVLGQHLREQLALVRARPHR